MAWRVRRAAAGSWAQMGSAGPIGSRPGLAGSARGKRELGHGSGSWVGARPKKGRFVFIIFRNYFSVRKQIQKILENVLKHEKYPRNPKNSKKTSRDIWDTRSPNKILEAHGKDSRAFQKIGLSSRNTRINFRKSWKIIRRTWSSSKRILKHLHSINTKMHQYECNTHRTTLFNLEKQPIIFPILHLL